MNDLDLEREIRATFQRRGADVLDPQAVPPVRTVLHKTRWHQLTTVFTGVVVAAALVAASVAGVGALIRSSERRVPVEPPDRFTAGALEAVPTDSHSFGSLTAATDRALWWTGPGLSRFDPDSGVIRTFTLADNPAFEYVSSIEPAREGGVWMLLDSNEIRRFDGEAFREILGPGPVCDLAEAPDGTLWGSGCERGVFRWDGASWVREPSDEGLGGGPIVVDAGGQVWVAGDRVVSSFNGRAWTTWTEGDGAPPDLGEPIVAGPTGEVWVGTDDGVARFLDGSWSEYTGSETGIPDVWSVAATNELVLITGYHNNQGRFALFDGSVWTSVTTPDGLGATSAHPSVAADPRGVLWAATGDAGLFRSDGSTWMQAVPSGGPSGLALASTGLDELWVTGGPLQDHGSYLGYRSDIWRIREGATTRYGREDGLPGGLVGAIAVAPDGVPWVATEEGLARFDGSRWEEIASGPHDAIAFGPDGSVWTASGSTIREVGGTAVPGQVPLLGSVTSFRVIRGDEIWAASCEGWWDACERAIAHFDGEAWEIVEPAGLADDSLVRDLGVTAEGDVWISALVPSANDRWAVTALRYRDGAWTEVVETDTEVPLDTPSPMDRGFFDLGGIGTTPDGRVLLLAPGGPFAFGDGSWSQVASGRFSDLSVASDGTVWLVGDGLFRLSAP